MHIEASAHAAAPPLADDSGSAFQTKPHTAHAMLCGDFNFAAGASEYREIQQSGGASRLRDVWPLLNGSAPHPATFHLFDRTYGDEPMACDFVFVSDSLLPHVKRIEVDLQTRASDHQPVLVTL